MAAQGGRLLGEAVLPGEFTGDAAGARDVLAG